jgi:hypothetical protein
MAINDPRSQPPTDGPLIAVSEAYEESFDGVVRDDPDDGYYQGSAGPTWRVVDQRVLHKAMAQVSVLEVPHGAPRYSIRVGTARITDAGDVLLSNHISIYDAEDAAALLSDFGEKYRHVRSTQRRVRNGSAR